MHVQFLNATVGGVVCDTQVYPVYPLGKVKDLRIPT